MTGTFFVYLMFFTEVIMLGYALKMTKGNFVSPSVITLIFFTVSFACFIYNVGEWIVVFSPKAYSLYTLSFAIMIAIEKHWIKKTERKRNYDYDVYMTISIRRPWNFVLFLFFSICSLLYVYRVYKMGMSLGATSLLMSIGVNKEDAEYDGLTRLLYNLVRMASYVYAVILCQNTIVGGQKLKQNSMALGILVLTFITTFFSGQRSANIAYLIAIVVAVVIAINSAEKTKRVKYLRRFRKYCIITAVVVLGGFYLSANAVKGKELDRVFIEYITYYFGSTNALMGRIIDKPEICHTPFRGYFGEKTFNGFWNAMYNMDVVSKEPCDREWILMTEEVGSIQAGNEYTFFCAPYIDFGYMGTLVFVALFFLLYSKIYYGILLSKPCTKKRCAISAIYLFLFTMVAMDFYQDTVRSYSRPINLLYFIYIFIFCSLFVQIKKHPICK